MRLKTPKDAPPGGWYYICPDGRRIDSDVDLRRLRMNVEVYYQANGIAIPADLGQIVEDQICERVPILCWKGFGDVVANAIEFAAGTVDHLFKTELKAKAKGCEGCGSVSASSTRQQVPS